MKNFNIQYSTINIQHSSGHRWRPGDHQPVRPWRIGRLFPSALDIGHWTLVILFLFLAWGSASTAQAAESSPRAAFDAGVTAFAASNYAGAAEAFLDAAADAAKKNLDPAAAYYNAGLAAYAGGDLEQASDHFARAAAGSDLDLQSKAYYNRGNVLFQLADQPVLPPVAPADPAAPPAPAGPGLDMAADTIGEAVQMYENAIALDPDDTDAKANYELAVRKQQQLQQQQQQQQDQQQDDQDDQEQDQQDQQQQNQNQQEDQQQQQNDQQEQQQQQQNQQQEESQEQEEEPQPRDSEPSEDMTPEEAEMMLDAMKAQEQSQRDRLQPFHGRPVPVEKDW